MTITAVDGTPICGESKSGYVCWRVPDHGPEANGITVHVGPTAAGMLAWWNDSKPGVTLKRPTSEVKRLLAAEVAKAYRISEYPCGPAFASDDSP